MSWWQILFVTIWGFMSLIFAFISIYQTAVKKRAYGRAGFLLWMGAFVWGDGVIFGPFWTIVSFITLYLNDWILFSLFVSVFWLVRSLGETFYWFNQQFSLINRNQPQHLPGFRFFKNNSVWFVHQIFWQCITVVTIISTIYLSALWIPNL